MYKKIRKKYKKAVWKALGLTKKTITVSTHQGTFTIPAESKDPISKSLFVNKGYEFDFVCEAMGLLQNEKYFKKGEGTIVDIGANNGVISIGAILNGEVARAIAIEPDVNNFTILEHNIKQNGLEHVFDTLNFAVSDTKSILKLEISTSNFGDHRIQKSTTSKELYKESKRKVVNVKSDTLDSLIKKINPDISLIWIDVQGHEGYVFKGATKILCKGMPVVSEIWPYGIERSGMSQQEFCTIVADTWSHYWVKRKNGFVKYATNDFYNYLKELGPKGDFDNVIFTP